jgi:hypothetical protein
MFDIDPSDQAQTAALVQKAIGDLEQLQARAVNKAMDRGMRIEEYEGFDARRRKIRKLKKIVASYEEATRESIS